MESTKLCGHKGSVNDVSVSAISPLLASASDDGTVRIWDQRTNKAVKCFREFFASAPQIVKFSPDSDTSLFVADEKCIYELDMVAGGILATSPMRILDRGADEDVEINAISVACGRIAVGDDNGKVSIFHANRETAFPANILEGVHSNLVGSVAIGGSGDCITAYSGGFDSIVASWDISTGHESNSFNFSSFYTGTTNPPFVHSISVLSLEQESDHILCALGNGRICLLNSNKLTAIASVEASGGMVCSIFSKENKVCSAGNHIIKIWDIREVAPSGVEPAVKISASERRRMRRKGGKSKTIPKEYDFFPTGDEIVHTSKINAIDGNFSADCTTVYVADVTSVISMYKIL